MKRFGLFTLDVANECLWHNGAQIALQPKPFAVLRYLVENPGRLVTHDELLDKLWPETFVQPQVLRTHMLELRKILGDDAAQPCYIQTLPKRGYSFVAAVSESADPPQAAFPPAAQPASLLGRERELLLLLQELAAVTAGQRRTVLVSGEAGMGKSALFDAFLRDAGSPVNAARGQCVPGAVGEEDFYPVVEALGELCASPAGEMACRILTRVAPAWLSLIGRAELCAGSPVPASAQERRPGSLCAALEAIATATPLILLFEDLQWADPATLNLISALARRRAPARLLIVASYRPRCLTEQNPFNALRHDLLMQQICSELALAPLPRTAIFEIVRRELDGGEIPARLALFVHERAEGNPLFAGMLLRHLLAKKLMVRRAGKDAGPWAMVDGFEQSAGIPDELARMVELEIERLSEHEQRLLEAASLMPVAFPAWAVAAALEQDQLECEEACAALARKVNFVQRAGEDELPNGTVSGFYAFTHGIYREVLYQRQTPSRRASRHIRIAERLGTLFAGCEAHVAREMAMHYEAAGSWERGAQALRIAAQYAIERNAEAEAAELLERASRLAEHSPAAAVLTRG